MGVGTGKGANQGNGGQFDGSFHCEVSVVGGLDFNL